MKNFCMKNFNMKNCIFGGSFIKKKWLIFGILMNQYLGQGLSYLTNYGIGVTIVENTGCRSCYFISLNII